MGNKLEWVSVQIGCSSREEVVVEEIDIHLENNKNLMDSIDMKSPLEQLKHCSDQI